MKKSLVAICMALVLVMCLPSVSVLADEEIKIYNSEWLSDYYSGDNNYNYLFGWNISISSNLSLAQQALEDFEANYNLPYYIATFNYDGTNWQYNFLCSESPIIMFFGGPIYYDTRTTMVPSWWTTNTSIMIYSYTYNSSQHSFNISSWTNTDYNGTKFVFSGNSLYCFAFKGENYALSLAEINSGGALNSYLSGNSIVPGNQDPIYRNVLSRLNVSDYFNYLQPDMPFYNGTEVIDPNGETVESNINHMYFNSCEIGFAEPYGVNNFATFGGSYFYVKYKVDDWILDHINEYDLYFSSTAYVGSRQYNGSKRVSLDSDGCITIPFSDIFTTDGGVVTNGFISAVSSKVVDQRFYKTYLYSIAGEKLQNFIDQQNNVSGSFSSAWDELVHTVRETYFFVYNGPNYFSEVIQDVVQSNIVSMSNVYRNYKINVNVYLVDNQDNRSGSVARLFDLYTGSDTSTDNQGLENENPYTDDSDSYLPNLPDDTQQVIQSIGSGTGVNVYNMTPSQIKLVIDNGFEKFVAWYNSDPSTAEVSTGFWNSFGIFRNNPAIDLYEEYFGFLPTGFKDIILGCATIGIVGGVFCAIRRKLT